MGSSSSKFRKHLQAGDEVQALQLYHSSSELRKALDPNFSYGDSHQHETPLHLAAKHGMQTLLRNFLYSKGGNPTKTNARKETCLHCVCMEANSQSIHVCKRRADCLSYLLKWRGGTSSDGQIERVDLAAQDEKLNTALHYAAASGLAQCVEILVQHGAPLFIENEDNMTPCDTAERCGYAEIALYLESKMVFSNDPEPPEMDDSIFLPPVEEYSGLCPQDLQEAKDHLLVETADMLSVPLFTAEALLRNHEWSREMLLEAWMNDPVTCCDKCGVIPPATLFSEKPQVQEDLASPLPSPLHKAPSPQDAECDICASTFPIANKPIHMTCEHQFCKECWERYLNVKIQEGDAHHITCPAYDCTMLVPIQIIEHVVSRDMALRYLQFDIKAFVDSNPDIKWCPFPGCGRAVKLPEIDLGLRQMTSRTKIPSDSSRGVDCGAGHYFCWECLEESHEPCSCENWSKWFQKINEVKPETLDGTEQETELAANCLWLVTNSKPCPNCKSPIQKNEGCNHMKCSKCKFDFCWVCLEQWKRHNSSTGGYFKCNRYEVLKKVEEHCANLVSEAEIKNKNMQELNRFVHYYTRFKNHENSYKLEEPLLQTVKDKMMKLAEAVTDSATAHIETKFVEDAVQQLLKARRVLKCSYVYGFYLDGPGYKKIVFEFMQTELEECTEILSQMVNRLYLRTPRRKIIDQAHIVQRKRLEFITAISKGLVPPETPPNLRRSKMKRKVSGSEADDDDLRKAIVASIQEVDPANPWIKDASGRHTNVMALLEWPSDESDLTDSDSEQRSARDSIGKCRRTGCNKVRAKNPRTNEHHDYCSRWCMQVDKEEQNRKANEGLTEIILDEHMELLRALEMSRMQYLRDNGLLHVSEVQDISQAAKGQARGLKHRPRSNSAGQQESSHKTRPLELSCLQELDMDLRSFHELTSSYSQGDTEDTVLDRKKQPSKSQSHRQYKMNQSSRFDECRSTVVPRVPNKSVEDLYCLEPAHKPSQRSGSQEQLEDSCSSNMSRSSTALSLDALTHHWPASSLVASELHSAEDELSPLSFSSVAKDQLSPLSFSSAAKDQLSPLSFSSAAKGTEITGSMFGAIKEISVSNIHSDERDKTRDFLEKDLTSIFSSRDRGTTGSSSLESSQLRVTSPEVTQQTLDICDLDLARGLNQGAWARSSCGEIHYNDEPVCRNITAQGNYIQATPFNQVEVYCVTDDNISNKAQNKNNRLHAKNRDTNGYPQPEFLLDMGRSSMAMKSKVDKAQNYEESVILESGLKKPERHQHKNMGSLETGTDYSVSQREEGDGCENPTSVEFTCLREESIFSQGWAAANLGELDSQLRCGASLVEHPGSERASVTSSRPEVHVDWLPGYQKSNRDGPISGGPVGQEAYITETLMTELPTSPSFQKDAETLKQKNNSHSQTRGTSEQLGASGDYITEGGRGEKFIGDRSPYFLSQHLSCDKFMLGLEHPPSVSHSDDLLSLADTEVMDNDGQNVQANETMAACGSLHVDCNDSFTTSGSPNDKYTIATRGSHNEEYNEFITTSGSHNTEDNVSIDTSAFKPEICDSVISAGCWQDPGLFLSSCEEGFARNKEDHLDSFYV